MKYKCLPPEKIKHLPACADVRNNSADKQLFKITSNLKLKQSLLINLLTILNYNFYNKLFATNTTNNLLNVFNKSNRLLIVDGRNIINRWNDAYTLFYNIFFYNHQYLIFSSAVFKQETLAINWDANVFDLNLWRYYSPFFCYKINRYNEKSNFFFKKLIENNINIFLITDINYHYKNLHYLKKKNAFTIGLISITDDLATVAYPILTLSDNYVVQLFFFKFVTYAQKNTLYNKYYNFKNKWQLLINKNII